jgi:hypothetical protein
MALYFLVFHAANFSESNHEVSAKLLGGKRKKLRAFFPFFFFIPAGPT